MFLQIKEIILWPRNQSLEPRRLPFEPGVVNIITGASRTGKSAVIPIIDYCLGSGKCRIPVKTIRDSCDWFGVVVQTTSGQRLFARREPGDQKATGDMFTLESSEIDIPERIESKNTTVATVKSSLDELAGLTNLDFDAEGIDLGFKGRPSFRDLGAFIFQPQNVVANSDVLFYKMDTYEHQEKLRTVFPYVLNAITPEVMAKQHELADLKRQLRRKEQELETVRNVSEKWMAEIQARVSEAKELGLIYEDIPPDAPREQLVELLTHVVHSSKDEVHITADTISHAVEELMELQTEESQVSMELSRLRRRFSEMQALRDTTVLYQGALHIQRDRLKVSEWIWELHDTGHQCPLCGGSPTTATEKLKVLHSALQAIEEEAGQFAAIPAAFDREFERVRSEIQIFSEKLRGIQIRRRSLEERSSEAKQRQYDSLKVSRFVGNLEQSLQTYSRIGEDGDLVEDVRELRDRIGALERDISQAQVDAKTKRALAIVSSNAQRLLPNLDCERPFDTVSLSISDLTISVGSLEREDYLWEIGSGSNWLAYHIAITLGLQQFFLGLQHSPVPSFIAYDQPSQVYFPKRLAVREEDTDLDPQLRDEDIEAVRKVFGVLASVVQESKGRLQIIVLDHAAENVWGSVEGVHCVEEWRNGVKLVPMSWLENSQDLWSS